MKSTDKNNPKAPAPPAVPDALRDFIKSVTPQKDAPLTELRERYAENLRHDPSVYTPLPIGSSPGSVEYMIEMRIRVWMHEREIEAARDKEAKEAAEKAAQARNNLSKRPPIPPAR